MVDDFKILLEKRAKSALYNPNEITDEALDVAVSETLEECSGLKVKSWAIMDFAMIRLKMYLKIALSEEDIVVNKSALACIKASPKDSEVSPKVASMFYAKI